MMQIVYFSQIKQFLTEMQSVSTDLLFVTPSPAKADILRSQIDSSPGIDVVTIAKFTSDLLKVLWSDENRPQIKRKAELLLIFGILKNKYFPDLGYEQFTQAYNLFSDLRSFTLNQDALASVLEEQPKEIKSATVLFWKLLEITGFMDEHGAYQKIAETLRSSDEYEELNKTFIFWGFQHLNGQQIDLLKALSIRYKVIVPFPLELKSKLKRSDWPSWLLDHKVEEVSLPMVERSPEGRWHVINSREMASGLRLFLEENSNIVLGVSKLKSHHLEIVPHSKVSFKVSHQILETELIGIADELKNDSPADLSAWLTEKRKDLLIQSTKGQMPFKKLKVLQLYEEALKLIQEMTDENVPLDSFFQKLLKEVVRLNQPRTSYIPLMKEVSGIELKDMSSIESIESHSKVILCIDERFEDIQGLGQNYTESIQKYLATLGPLKRNELELHFKQWEFEDLFTKSDVTVLMSETVLKHSLIWKKLFSSIKLEKMQIDIAPKTKQLKDYFSDLPKRLYDGHFSASRLQSYMDCPRNFYYSYVEKITPKILLEKDIDPLTSGTIIHEIIEKYFHRGFSEDLLPNLVKEVFQLYIKKNDLKLPPDVYHHRELIFQHRSMNGIGFLNQIEEAMREKLSWHIEEKFEEKGDFTLLGQIDCIGIGEKNLFLLDFKSSAGAARTNAEVEKMESVQLWVYALAAQKKIPDFHKKSITIGYVVLDDPSKSNLLFSDEDSMSKIKSAKIGRPAMLSNEFFESLKEAQIKISEIVNAIQTDTKFLPRPRKAEACQYCELVSVCVKSELNHV